MQPASLPTKTIQGMNEIAIIYSQLKTIIAGSGISLHGQNIYNFAQRTTTTTIYQTKSHFSKLQITYSNYNNS